MTIEHDNLDNLLERARTTEADLRTKLDAARASIAEIDVQRADQAYAAHTGDDAAKKTIEKLNRKRADAQIEIESLEKAIEEAGRRVNAAEREAAEAAERERARAVLERVGEFRRSAKAVDAALAAAVAEYAKLRESLDAIHQLGCSSPTTAQLRSLGQRAAMTALMGSDPQIEHLAPRERRTLGELADEWGGCIEDWAARRIGAAALKVIAA